MPRIVLLGATGYTGRLIAGRLVERGVRPVLAGRSPAALALLSAQLGGQDVLRVDVGHPASLQAALQPGDVLVTTVGPFLRHGDAALECALGAGAHYVDVTGEAPFVARVVAAGARAAERDLVLLPATGFDFVAGNLAGALAARRCAGRVRRLDIGYFFTGSSAAALSRGTRASASGVLVAPSFTFRAGRLVDERSGARVRRYDIGGERAPALTLGASESIFLPRSFPELTDVDVHQGALGRVTPLVAQAGRLGAVPWARRAVTALGERLAPGSTGGPPATLRARSGTRVVAIASDAAGDQLEKVVLEGPNAYELTAALAAWAAEQVAAGTIAVRGALGPVEAFGLDALLVGCREAELIEVAP